MIIFKKSDKIPEEDFQFYNTTYYGYILGGLTHVVFLLFFYTIGLKPMVYLNVLSLLIFLAAFISANKNKLNFAFSLILSEVIIHAFISVYYLGFNSGFQYYLYALAPIVFFNPKWKYLVKVILIALLGISILLMKNIFYFGTGQNLSNIYLIDYAMYFNVFNSFAMFSLIAFYYENAVNSSKRILREKNIELELKNNKILQQVNELAELNNKLEMANNSKDKFFSIIAHDLKNPLSALFISTELLSNYYDRFNSDQIKDNIIKLHNSSKQLRELLDNLLEWARSQTGGIEFSPESININEILEDNVRLLQINLKSKNILVNSEFDYVYRVSADKNMINTVIRNLLTNAVKYTHNNGTITLSIKYSENYIIIKISDTGVGIPSEKIDKLFRIDNNSSTAGTSNEKGTGLGLILCKEFIDKHNGRISVESKIGIGSSFYIQIPMISKN